MTQQFYFLACTLRVPKKIYSEKAFALEHCIYPYPKSFMLIIFS